MRFFGYGETLDLGALYLSLLKEGAEVRACATEPLAEGTLRGLVPRLASLEAGLDWVGREGVVIFESVSAGQGAMADDLRRGGYQVVGGSAYGDRLETDREFGQAELEAAGLTTPPRRAFASTEEALNFVRAHPGRYVVKASGPEHSARDTYVGGLADGRDVLAELQARAGAGRRGPLLLTPRIEGVEVGVGAYFDGSRFIPPACIDFEHKRFFPGDLGELSGEMGTVATFDRSQRFFERTLARMAPALAAQGHRGYVNLNTLVNEAGVWPLEFTCRFGYPGYSILSVLQRTPWRRLLHAMAAGEGLERHETRRGFSVGLVLTTPPFPYSRLEVEEPVGRPVVIEEGLPEDAVHFGEVGLSSDGALVTSGLYGWSLVVTGVAEDLRDARARALAAAEAVFIPDLRYRRDIGERLAAGELARAERLGVFGSLAGRDEGLPR